MPETDYQPVPHDAAFRDALLAKPGVQKAFDALEEEYTALHAMLDAQAHTAVVLPPQHRSLRNSLRLRNSWVSASALSWGPLSRTAFSCRGMRASSNRHSNCTSAGNLKRRW